MPGKPLPLSVTRENTNSNETVENYHLTGKSQYDSVIALLRLGDSGSITQPGGASWSTPAPAALHVTGLGSSVRDHGSSRVEEIKT